MGFDLFDSFFVIGFDVLWIRSSLLDSIMCEMICDGDEFLGFCVVLQYVGDCSLFVNMRRDVTRERYFYQRERYFYQGVMIFVL